MNEAKNGRCPAGQYYCYTNKECKPIPAGFMVDPEGMLRKENGATVDEANKSGDNSLRDWFSKSKSSDGKPGWVQLGGKYAGKPCAKQPGQTTKPKCGSSKMKRNLSKDEEERAFRRKNRKDPNPNRSGKAINVKTEETIVEKAPKYDKKGNDKFDRYKSMVRHKQDKYGVSTLKQRVMHGGVDHNIDNEKKAKGMKEEFTTLPLQLEIPNNIRDFNLGLMFRESLDINSGMLFVFEDVAEQSFHMRETKIPLDIAFIREDGIIESIKELEPFDESAVASNGKVRCALEVNRGWFAENNVEVGDEIEIEEGKKDACYHKVKSRYKVWPSAYASGALVKCRKKGAANWGNSTKKEEFSNWRDDFVPTDYETIDLIKPEPLKPTEGIGSKMLGEKCWKGYEKKGMKTMFGKRYPNCVKKEETEIEEKKDPCWDTHKQVGMKKKGGRLVPNCVPKEEASMSPQELQLQKKRARIDRMIAQKRQQQLATSKAETPAKALGEEMKCSHTAEGMDCPVHGKTACDGPKKPRGGNGGKPGPDKNYVKPMGEAVRIPAKTGNIVDTYFSYRGKNYGLKMFFPQISVPKKSDVQDQISKVYPGARVITYTVSDYEPGQPLLHTEGAAWTKKAGKNKEGGLNEKGRKSYERENPGSDLKAPSKKVGNPRRASFCARMKGMKKKLTSSKTANDPDSRINKSLRAWNC